MKIVEGEDWKIIALKEMSIQSYFVPAFGGGFLMILCYSFGRMHYSIIWISLIVLLNVLASKLWKTRQRRVIALQQAALREKEIILAQLKDLPAWVQFPDTERVEWMNKVIFQLWPYIGDYTKSFIKDIVEPQVKARLPGPFKAFRFEEIDMGDIPLRVGGIKVYTENVGRDRIIMDMDVAYAGDCEFVVSVGMFKGGLKQMQFKGKLRAILTPLLPKPPMIGGVSAFFLDEPAIDFDLTGLGEFVELPGLMGAIRSVVKSQVSAICVLPNEIVVPLTTETDVVKLRFPEPEGVIRFEILQAKDLENRDNVFTGKSDPYVVASVGAQIFRTKTIDNTLSPVWNEKFEAVVDQSSGQKLILETFDDDPGSNDEFIGRLALDLSVIRQKGSIDQWYLLEGVKKGEIRIRAQWFNLSCDKANLLASSDDVKTSDAILMVYVDNVSDLPSPKRDIEPSPYLELAVGKYVQKTNIRAKTCHPLYQQKFTFFVSNVEHQSLRIEAKDSSQANRPLGDILLPIRALLKERNLELKQQCYHLALGPHLSPVVLTLRLRALIAKTDQSQASVVTPPTPDVISSTSMTVGGANVTQEKRLVTVAASPTESTTLTKTQTIITPQYIGHNGKDSGGKAAWRNAAFSSGAQTVSSKPKSTIVQRIQRSRLVSFGKLNKRRSISTTFDGYSGRIHVTLSYSNNKSRFNVQIHSAEHLRAVNFDGVADPYISVKLLKLRAVVSKHKTCIYSNTLNPVVNQTFAFDVPHADLLLCTLLLEVKDSCNYGWFKRPPIMGQVSYDLSHFKTDVSITQWFTLSAPSMDQVSLASVPVIRNTPSPQLSPVNEKR